MLFLSQQYFQYISLYNKRPIDLIYTKKQNVISEILMVDSYNATREKTKNSTRLQSEFITSRRRNTDTPQCFGR